VTDRDRVEAWTRWLEDFVHSLKLDDAGDRDELAEYLSNAVETVDPVQPMGRALRERWWRAWLRLEVDQGLDLAIGAHRQRLATVLAQRVSVAPYRDERGWRVYGR